MTKKKLVIIGGGSAYIPGYVKAFLAKGGALLDFEIILHDIDDEAAQLIALISNKTAEAINSPVRFIAEPNRKKALEGADYILTSFRAGGFEMRLHDEKIPLKYGVIGHETVGPGGFFYALRTVPIIRDICAEIEKVCPQAVLLNYTNPTNIVTEAVSRFSSVKVYGMCDQPPHDAEVFAGLLRREGKLEFRSAGLNHATWGISLTLDGEDIMLETITRAGEEIGNSDYSEEEQLQFELATRTGLIPSKYMQYYYYPRRTVERAKSSPKTRTDHIIAGLPEIFEHLRAEAAKPVPHVVKHRGSDNFGDFAVNILAALAGGEPITEPLNIINYDFLPQLPDGMIVEVPCKIDKNGVKAIAPGNIPIEHSGLIRSLGDFQVLAAEVAWGGTRSSAIIALAANPLIGDIDLADAIYADLADACADYLPERLK